MEGLFLDKNQLQNGFDLGHSRPPAMLQLSLLLFRPETVSTGQKAKILKPRSS